MNQNSGTKLHRALVAKIQIQDYLILLLSLSKKIKLFK